MCTQSTLTTLLSEAGANLRNIFGEKLETLLLYGSYARGDYDSESDIDVFALIDMDKEELSRYRKQVSTMANDIDLKYDVLLSVKLQDKSTFEKYQQVLPFYRNVVQEGVRVNV